VSDGPGGATPLLSLRRVEDAIRAAWSIETCDPTDIPSWTTANRARGQCAVTTLVVHDLLGGQMLEAEVHFRDGSRQGFHYWNRLDGFDLDLTLEQFTTDEVVQEPTLIDWPSGVPWRAHEQYLIFRKRVYADLGLEEPKSFPDAGAGVSD
jgi:hypothetical protein